MSAPKTTLRNVEDGYAEVWSGKLQLGSVAREKFGSTRTGTRWVAFNLRQRTLGHADTREAAVRIVASGPRY